MFSYYNSFVLFYSCFIFLYFINIAGSLRISIQLLWDDSFPQKPITPVCDPLYSKDIITAVYVRYKTGIITNTVQCFKPAYNRFPKRLSVQVCVCYNKYKECVKFSQSVILVSEIKVKIKIKF
jgi:hypothetical protein